MFNVAATRVVDVASWVQWTDDDAVPGRQAREARVQLARQEVDGDALRLLYVALTRAKHRVELWWAPTKRSGSSAFGRLLFDRLGPGPVENSPIGGDFEKRGDKVEMTRRQLGALAEASNGTIAVHDVAVTQPIRRPLPIGTTPGADLAVAASERRPLDDPTWRSWSFTAITQGAGRRPSTAQSRNRLVASTSRPPGSTA